MRIFIVHLEKENAGDLYSSGNNCICLGAKFYLEISTSKAYVYRKDFDVTSVLCGLSYYFFTIFNIVALQTILSISMTLGNETQRMKMD